MKPQWNSKICDTFWGSKILTIHKKVLDGLIISSSCLKFSFLRSFVHNFFLKIRRFLPECCRPQVENHYLNVTPFGIRNFLMTHDKFLTIFSFSSSCSKCSKAWLDSTLIESTSTRLEIGFFLSIWLDLKSVWKKNLDSSRLD